MGLDAGKSLASLSEEVEGSQYGENVVSKGEMV